MTAMTAPTPATPDPAPGPAATPLVIAADGSYAARLVEATVGDATGWCPERWTLDGPEPYAVRLPGGQPEEPDSPVAPLSDGRVLIGRRADGRYHFSLLYPSGPDTGELPLGAVECERLTLLPPAPDGVRVYALVYAGDSAESAESEEAAGDAADEAETAETGDMTELWQVCGGAFGPELVARIDGRCGGGAWLDRDGRLLALDRTDDAGQTRAIAVTVDAPLGGPPSELLRIAEDSNDRLLLADPDSGLLLVSSDAPGQERIGWGVLGSHRPVRFPEALHQPGASVVPIAVQPGQVLLPESCGIALRMTTAEADWVVVWRPQQRELQHLAAPEGWLAGAGLWTAEGELLLPYASAEAACGLARVTVPVPEPSAGSPAGSPAPGRAGGTGADAASPTAETAAGASPAPGPAAGTGWASGTTTELGTSPEPGAGTEPGTGQGLATGPAPGSGTGQGTATGPATETDPATGIGTGTGTDPGPETSLIPETSVIPESGLDPGTGPEPAPGPGPGPGPGMEAAPRSGTGQGTATGPGTGTEPGTGTGLGTDTGPQREMGAVTGPGPEPAPGPGAEMGPAPGFAPEPGVGPSVEAAASGLVPEPVTGPPATGPVAEQAARPTTEPIAEPVTAPTQDSAASERPRPPTEVAKPVPLSQAPLARVG
ncbi:hypothetical protein [Streptomyces sp. 6N223]|uniref:hypothetical protein n=1 Tax=Streptomyces sp. 6N223 TaxID=3457412 RepID=UPI003FD3A3EB